MLRQMHLKDSLTKQLITFLVNYSDSEEEAIVQRISEMEVEFRKEVHYYVRRGEYKTNEVLVILEEMKKPGFIEKGLENVDIEHKQFIITKLHSMFRRIQNYMHILKNWYG